MRKVKLPFACILFGISALLHAGCEECKSSFDCKSDQVCVTGKCRSSSGDLNVDPDSGTPSTPSGGSGGGKESDAGDSCKNSYPAGPWKWEYNGTVPEMSFNAIYGTEGEIGSLDMCEVFLDSKDIRSLAFVIGTDSCDGCPARFQQIGELEDDIRNAHSDLVGLYYADITGNNKPLEDVSRTIDSFGWSKGWRIQDNNSGILWDGKSQGSWLVDSTSMPFVFILNTDTMKVVKAEGSHGPLIDVLAEVQALDQEPD